MLLGLGNSLTKGGNVIGSLDPDAKTYIAAVEAADGQTLESGVKKAYNTFVKGCKSDGIWDAIKASCVMAGARTLSGALVPLKGTAPTNFNFVSGDYNRQTGLVGDGSTKYLDSNRNVNVDPRDNFHQSVYASAVATTGSYIGSGGVSGGSSQISISASDPTAIGWRVRNGAGVTVAGTNINGLIAQGRSNSTTISTRTNRTSASIAQASEIPFNGNSLVFARLSGGVVGLYSIVRLAFYSIGESLDLSKLDSRVDRLVAELAFNINTGLDGSIYDIDTLKYINAGYAAGGTLS